ncbi:MAG: HAMP domain-containing histidine kinase [Clostridia bacterium]|nr:HAMP domain-containing histidine kinase [Clostridia bacterium]
MKARKDRHVRTPAHKRLRGRLRIKSFRTELILIIFFLMLATSGFTVLVYALLHLIFPSLQNFDTVASSASTLIACTIIGTGAAAFLTKWILSPLKEMIDATERIAKGDFKVHIQESFDEESDFGILQRSFNHMAGELDGIEMFRNDFINNFSHEFKTPIVSIQGFAHQLQAGGLTPEEEREYIRIIAAESDRLAKMATNILLLSKLENQAIVTDKTEFFLDEQIRTCLLILEKQWSSKDIELNIDLDEVKYCFNETMLSHVWLNLFSNAIKFTPPSGTVSCTLRATDEQIKVTVSDTGIGMDENTVRHIFEKFYQGDTSHTGDGNGIGLTIVGRILVLCRGHIDVESKPDMGSTFTVTLPATVPSYEDVIKYEEET